MRAAARSRRAGRRVARTAALAVAAAVILVACASPSPANLAAGDSAADGTTVAAPAGAWHGEVTRIADGDTLWVRVREPGADGPTAGAKVKLRLLRIDAPEIAHGDQLAECLGEEATAHLADLTPVGSEVRAAYDLERQDRYGRDLVHLWTASGIWVNGRMLADGYASVMTFPPNVAYDEEVRALEEQARAAGRGLWSRC